MDVLVYIGSTFRDRFEEQLRQRHDAEMQRLQAEEDKVMDIEKEAQEARLTEKQVGAHFFWPRI